MPYMQFVDRIEGRMVKKIWCGNMRHCTTGLHRQGPRREVYI